MIDSFKGSHWYFWLLALLVVALIADYFGISLSASGSKPKQRNAAKEAPPGPKFTTNTLPVPEFVERYKDSFGRYVRKDAVLLRNAYHHMEKETEEALKADYGKVRLVEILGPATEYPQKAHEYMREVILKKNAVQLEQVTTEFLTLLAKKCEQNSPKMELQAATLVAGNTFSLQEAERVFGKEVKRLFNDGMGGSSYRVFEFVLAHNIAQWQLNFLIDRKKRMAAKGAPMY